MSVAAAVSDFFVSQHGKRQRGQWWRRRPGCLRLFDAIADARVGLGSWRRRAAVPTPPMSVLVAAVRAPGREADLARVIEHISITACHRVTVGIADMGSAGKFDNINQIISTLDLKDFDWLLIIDDDISFDDGILDVLLHFAHAHDLKLSQPAHRFQSHSTYPVTERHLASLARQVGFVEIGPVTLLHRDTFQALIPFPSLRWAWGLDVFWAQIARQRGWKMGVIDAAPIQHLRPVGGSYSPDAARQEGAEFLQRHAVNISSAEIFATNRRIA